MQIYQFWARSAVDCTTPAGQPYHLIAYAGSDESPAEALTEAEKVLEARWNRLQRGEKLSHYPIGAAPLREKLVQRLHGGRGEETGAITRNAYGARVLNTKAVMFIDVDRRDLLLRLSTGPGFWVWLLLRLRLLPTPPPLRAQDAQALLEARIKTWLATHPDWSFRLYQTRAGFRLLVTHAEISPTEAVATAVFNALGADEVYARLCRLQACYRARLSPKPWRIGLKRPVHSFPYQGEAQEAEQAAWEAQYSARSQEFSVCELLGSYGSGRVCPAAQQVLALHDAACLGGRQLA